MDKTEILLPLTLIRPPHHLGGVTKSRSLLVATPALSPKGRGDVVSDYAFLNTDFFVCL